MTQILIASGNSHKHEELARLLRGAGLEGVELLRPAELGLGTPPPDPGEDGSTYLENAAIKARAFSEWSGGLPALADDSGLEVDALDGAPGLRSARYAGEKVTFDQNIAKLLAALGDRPPEERRGRFICALVLVRGGDLLFETEGTCGGIVLHAPTGGEGFGYDPIFRPDGETRSFSEMSELEKDARSHRGLAFRAFTEHLRGSPLVTAGSGGPPRP